MPMGYARSSQAAAAALALVALTATAGAVSPPRSAHAAGQRFDLTSWTDPDGRRHVVRWDPCLTVTYAVNAARAGSTRSKRRSAVADVRAAFTRAAAQTGMSFRFVGRTREVPRDTSASGWAERQSAAEVVVAWVTPRTSNLLNGSGSRVPAGTGGWSYKAWTSGSGWRLAVGRGFVVLNARDKGSFAPGFGSGVTRGALLLHEVGHALGLNHVGSTRQIMYPTMLDRRSSSYKYGDGLGLDKLGRPAGCLNVPPSVWTPLPRP